MLPATADKPLQMLDVQSVREFNMPKTRISVAPTPVNSSMTFATSTLGTMELTATHSASSNAVTVGARLPGVMSSAAANLDLGTLYWQRTYFFASACPSQRLY